jgi:peptide/nickel transport system ATP-binding protein
MQDSKMQIQGLRVKNLSIWYKTYRGYAQVVDCIDLEVKPGEKIGLVGESGCGKTTTMKMIMRILEPGIIYLPKGGEIWFQGENVLKMNKDELLKLRRQKISMISQSPMSALNPVLSIGTQLRDVIKYSGVYKNPSKKELNDVAREALTSVMLSDPDRLLRSYPHQLSGGMRQRICIAASLVTPRELLIADEPSTALDVTVQDQIHRILRELVEKKGRSLIMITHSLGVARELVDRIYIMYGGTIIEECLIESLFRNPSHPYTKGLLESVPRLSGGGLSTGIYGYIPDYVHPPKGCRFCPRCPSAMDICKEKKPALIEIEQSHKVACFLYGDKSRDLEVEKRGQIQ